MEFTAKASGMKSETGSCECAEPEHFPCGCEDGAEPDLETGTAAEKITKAVSSPAEQAPVEKIVKAIGSKPLRKDTKQDVQ